MVNRTMPSASTSGAKPNVSLISALVAANGSGSRTMACQVMPSTFTVFSSRSSRLVWCQNLEYLRRLAACLLRRRTLAWPLPTRNPLYVRYWGVSWTLFTEVPRETVWKILEGFSTVRVWWQKMSGGDSFVSSRGFSNLHFRAHFDFPDSL